MLDYDWRPSGESFEDVKERVLSVLREIKDERSDEETLIVAHGGIIRMLYFIESDGGILDDIGNVSLHSFDLDKILK
jgi:broad specificity phosphatase PhoE